MEPGKIRIINSGGQSENAFSQTIALAINNRLYRITNNGSIDGGPGVMTISISRSFFFFTIKSEFDLDVGRSVDVYGSTIKVLALTSLQLLGTYDTI